MIGLCLLCSSHVLRGQNSNSTSGGFMSQFNSWINRLRGNNNNQNNNNNNNNSDKEKETQNAGQQTPGQQQMTPVQYMPYPIMTGMTGMPSMSGMYSPMSPMTMSFAPRPMPSAFGPGIPFGSMAAGSSIGPNLGPSMGMGSSLASSLGSSMGSSLASSMGSSMASSLASPMSSAMSSNYPGISQLNSMRPSYSSASHMMP